MVKYLKVKKLAQAAAAALPTPLVEVHVTNNWAILNTTDTSLFEAVKKTLTVPRKVFKRFGYVKRDYGSREDKRCFITSAGRFGTGL